MQAGLEKKRRRRRWSGRARSLRRATSLEFKSRVGGTRSLMEAPRVESHWPEASRKFFFRAAEVLRACVEQNRDMCRSTCLIFRRNRGTRYLIEGLNTSAPAFFRAPDPADGEARTSLTLSKVGRRARFEPALGCRPIEARSTPQGSRPPRPPAPSSSLPKPPRPVRQI